jgi:hypothetical protein
MPEVRVVHPVYYGLSAIAAVVLAVITSIVMREQGSFMASNYAAVVGVCLSMPWALYWFKRRDRDLEVLLAAVTRAACASGFLGLGAAWISNITF